ATLTALGSELLGLRTLGRGEDGLDLRLAALTDLAARLTIFRASLEALGLLLGALEDAADLRRLTARQAEVLGHALDESLRVVAAAPVMATSVVAVAAVHPLSLLDASIACALGRLSHRGQRGEDGGEGERGTEENLRHQVVS